MLLVNAVRDGMNLVAKESAVINEKRRRPRSLRERRRPRGAREHAVSVNPYDVDGQADALHAALTMPRQESERRSRAVREEVESNTIEDWVEAQIRDIEAYREQHG